MKAYKVLRSSPKLIIDIMRSLTAEPPPGVPGMSLTLA